MQYLLDNPQYLFVIAVAIVLHISIVRLVFSIPTIARHLKAQTKLMALMAKKQGIELNVIEEIVNTAEDNAYERNTKELDKKTAATKA